MEKISKQPTNLSRGYGEYKLIKEIGRGGYGE